MKLKEVLDRTIQFFKDKKMDQPRLEAEWLVASGLGLNRVELYMKYEQPLKDIEVTKLRDFVRRRSQGEPLAYITGTKGFYKLDFKVTQDVLIPRPETEILVETCLDWIKQNLKSKETIRILDLGTGSGCIGLTLAYEWPKAKVHLVDVSEKAIEIAKENAKNLELEERCLFHRGDSLAVAEEIPEQFDLIVSNPPYIDPLDPEVQDSVKKYEPHQALFTPGGTQLLKNWTQKYLSKLEKPSLMMMEMGYKQGPEMEKFYQDLKCFDQVRVIKDYSGHDRFILGSIYG